MSDGAPAGTERSSLHEAHEALGARFTTFSGWDLPLRYQGALAEHQAVRSSAGIFDVSHLGRFSLEGEGATAALRRLFCNDVAAVAPGRAQYTMMLTPQGGVVDDLIVWRWDEERYWVLPNAANHARVMGAVAAEAAPATVRDHRPETALLAVQGPDAPDLVASVLGAAPKRFRLLEATFRDAPVWAAGTGYTGEPGAEIAVPSSRAADLWEAFLAGGAVPCGLGARDGLRLEMGFPLWGQDLDTSTTPLEGGFEWVVAWDDHDFVGRDALAAQRSSGVPKRLIGLVAEGRRIPRPGSPLRCGPGTGRITSGGFSPVLDAPIALGYVSPEPGDNDHEVLVEVRGHQVAGRRVDPPFVSR